MPKYREPEPEPTPATPEEKSEEEDNAPNYDGQFGKKSYFISLIFRMHPKQNFVLFKQRVTDYN